MKYDVADLALASKGKLRIEWAANSMPVLSLIKKRFKKEKLFKGVTVGACLHVTAETANLVLALKDGGAKVFLCASNPLSTQDDVAGSLVKDYKIPVFAIKGEDKKRYYSHIKSVLGAKPNITMDDGADLVASLHKLKIKNEKLKTTIQNAKLEEWEMLGSSEETTTGVVRLKAMEKDKALKIPVLATNDSQTKYLFDNRYGTGQSSIDGILRATNILLAGKKFVVCGYGWCGRGIACRARGMGAHVVICEVNPIKALEALMDGFEVMSIKKAAKIGDIFVTSTGDKNVIDIKHIKVMKNGVILANAGHFNVEINVQSLEKLAVSKKKIRENIVEYKIPNPKSKIPNFRFKRIYLLGEGRLINLVAAEGHPPDVMDLSFSNQALAAEWFLKNKGKLKPRVYKLPKEIDRKIAQLKLISMGIKIDKLTREQKKYLTSWQEGT